MGQLVPYSRGLELRQIAYGMMVTGEELGFGSEGFSVQGFGFSVRIQRW